MRLEEGRRPTVRRRWIAAAAVALFAFPSFRPAHAQSPAIQAWVAQGALCKGGRPDDPKTVKACARRQQVGERLKRKGCEYQEDGDWWKCPH